MEKSAKKTNQNPAKSENHFSCDYLKTSYGIMKLIVICLGFCCFVLTQLKGWEGDYVFAVAVGLGLFESFRALLVYLLKFPESFHMSSWLVFEIAGICVVTTVYFIASLTVIQDYENEDKSIDYLSTTAGILGFTVTAAYGFSGFLKFLMLTKGALKK